MAKTVVAFRAEDVVLDFLSVLDATKDEELRVLVASTGERVTLRARTTPDERVAALASARAAAAADTRDAPVTADALRAWLASVGGTGPLEVWTHSPADDRRTRRLLGHDTAIAAGAAHGSGNSGGTVWHAVGDSPYLQFRADDERPLTPALIRAKLDFVNAHRPHLLGLDDPEEAVTTARVPAVERFFRSDPEERGRLYALMSSLDDGAATVADPWEFETSPYERERLDATAAWVTRWCPPGEGRLVEAGACEGALTRRLADKGYAVEATEPNAAFRRRLERAAHGPGVTVHPHGLDDLARAAALPAAAYLLIEMLYYGQDLDALRRLPTDRLFVALAPDWFDERLRPWLDADPGWRVRDRAELVAPRLESVCGARAHLVKRGSRGVLLERSHG
ncbi:hypothetical protein [Streptomyces radicis]|uniref:hypothetical protein n=1 Tax=Streptomyces radicis TaxID=1750517 RepID=UPI001E48F094|nr:hypothetical protein [Streptomyces radicis]